MILPTPYPKKFFDRAANPTEKVGGGVPANPWIIACRYRKSLIVDSNVLAGLCHISTGLYHISTGLPKFSTDGVFAPIPSLSSYLIKKKEKRKAIEVAN